MAPKLIGLYLIDLLPKKVTNIPPLLENGKFITNVEAKQMYSMNILLQNAGK